MTAAILLAMLVAAPWDEQGTDDGVAVWTRPIEGIDSKEVRAVGRFDAPPAEVFAALIDVPNMTRNRPHTVEARLIEKKGNVLRYYQRLDPPVVSARDYVLDGTMTRVGEGGFRLSVKAVSDPRVPEVKGVVRLSLIRGSWTIEPADGGKASKVSYEMLTDPKTSMPSFAANRAAIGATRDVFQRMREAVRRPEYRGAKPDLGLAERPAGDCKGAVARLEVALEALPNTCAVDADCAAFELRAYPCAPGVALPKGFDVGGAAAASYRALLGDTKAACADSIPKNATCERVAMQPGCRDGRCANLAFPEQGRR